jgi:hypothetical protein
MWQIPHMMVRDFLPATVHDHEPSVGSISQRLLGHQPARQLVVEKLYVFGHAKTRRKSDSP